MTLQMNKCILRLFYFFRQEFVKKLKIVSEIEDIEKQNQDKSEELNRSKISINFF